MDTQHGDCRASTNQFAEIVAPCGLQPCNRDGASLPQFTEGCQAILPLQTSDGAAAGGLNHQEAVSSALDQQDHEFELGSLLRSMETRSSRTFCSDEDAGKHMQAEVAPSHLIMAEPVVQTPVVAHNQQNLTPAVPSQHQHVPEFAMQDSAVLGLLDQHAAAAVAAASVHLQQQQQLQPPVTASQEQAVFQRLSRRQLQQAADAHISHEQHLPGHGRREQALSGSQTQQLPVPGHPTALVSLHQHGLQTGLTSLQQQQQQPELDCQALSAAQNQHRPSAPQQLLLPLPNLPVFASQAEAGPSACQGPSASSPAQQQQQQQPVSQAQAGLTPQAQQPTSQHVAAAGVHAEQHLPPMLPTREGHIPRVAAPQLQLPAQVPLPAQHHSAPVIGSIAQQLQPQLQQQPSLSTPESLPEVLKPLPSCPVSANLHC